jgi:hypothetical protein
VSKSVAVSLGETYPVGHPSGRVYPPPVSLEQARARVHHGLLVVEDAARDRIDLGYAVSILDEAYDDWYGLALKLAA